MANDKITLLTGIEKRMVELKPAGDKLEASGAIKVGPNTKIMVMVRVTNAGKSAGTLRFALM